MTLQIGRLTGLTEPMLFQSDGLTATLGGIHSTTTAFAPILRDQLLGYSSENIDESVIPIVIASETRLSGYYRVTSVHVDTDPTLLARGLVRYTFGLERITSFGAPTMEAAVLSALRPNTSGITGVNLIPWHSVPNVATEYVMGPSSWGGIVNTRPADEGGLVQMFVTIATTGRQVARYSVPVASFYNGAARIEDNVGVSNTFMAIGTEMPIGMTNWRLSNGILRVMPFGTSGVSCSWYNGTLWGVTHSFKFRVHGTADFVLQAVRILRNAPEQCILRLVGTMGSAGVPTPTTIDIALRRGSRTLDCLYSNPPNYSAAFSVIRSAAYAATALTGGIIATAADADSNKWVLTSASPLFAFTTDLVNAEIYTNSIVPYWDCGISCAIGAVPGTLNTGQELIYEYMAAQGERQMVVGR